ncbi:FmdB family zinc ribbon protein [Phosphitispora sp. TUW77]|uniref:FmdB family zinc ribbon protein n=1 Tax=Phosphitispora sp. TUW77 TaxID=3152361 RepID=UPI003AB25B44
MPAYDFKCKTCDTQFTVNVPVNEREKVKCPECASSDVKQIFTSFSITVKGTSGKPSCEGGCGSGSRFG